MNEQVKGQLEILNQQVKELISVYRETASKYDISENEFWLWYALLALDGEYSQQDICSMWSLPKQTVNSIVMNLVKKKQVSLEVIPGTRNRKVIRPTEEGMKYGKSIIASVYAAETCALEQFSESERKICVDLLTRYIEALKSEIKSV